MDDCFSTRVALRVALKASRVVGRRERDSRVETERLVRLSQEK